MAQYTAESSEIEAFGGACEALLSPLDLKDTMAAHLPAFLSGLHTVKKLYKVEKHGAQVTRVIREKIDEVIKSRTADVL